MTKTEKMVCKILQSKGYDVYHNGWPDFLVHDSKKNEICFIEVKKQATEKLNINQIKLHEVLRKFDIPVLIIRTDCDLDRLKTIETDFEKKVQWEKRWFSMVNLYRKLDILQTRECQKYLSGKLKLKYSFRDKKVFAIMNDETFPKPIITSISKKTGKTYMKKWSRVDVDQWLAKTGKEKYGCE